MMNRTRRPLATGSTVGLPIGACLLITAVTSAQMIYASIVIQPVGRTLEICQLWSAAAGSVLDSCRKTLRVPSEAVVENGTYNHLYQEFVAGGLRADTDTLNTQPRWNKVVDSDLIKSELTLQWKMVAFLESGGVRSRSVESLKQTLFAQQLAVENGNRSERLFDQLRQQRLSILKLQ
jgi:hypothetical protein